MADEPRTVCKKTNIFYYSDDTTNSTIIVGDGSTRTFWAMAAGKAIYL